MPDASLQALEALADLTPREREFFLLFLRGQPMKEIAACMGLDPRTVSDIKVRLLTRLKMSSEVQLAIYGSRIGLIDLDGNVSDQYNRAVSFYLDLAA